MKIASILPYKENYTEKGAGAVALWINSFIRDSKYKMHTYIIGSTSNKNYLSNFIDMNLNLYFPSIKTKFFLSLCQNYPNNINKNY